MKYEIEKNSESDAFLKLLLANQTRIYAYILGLVGNYSDADDILQETTCVLWKKFNEFKFGTDFVAWGVKVAHYKVLDYRRKMQKMNLRVIFDDDVLDVIIPKTEEANKHLEKLSLIQECLKKLSDRDFHFIKLRYYEGVEPRQISGLLGMSIQTVYKALARMHGRLLKCMKYGIEREVF